ncbi:MAG: hypothetical protein NT031_05800, partial [Planctomycetota bacterium]|nr:hypothetical protein [Planctomycetota bacterium]
CNANIVRTRSILSRFAIWPLLPSRYRGNEGAYRIRRPFLEMAGFHPPGPGRFCPPDDIEMVFWFCGEYLLDNPSEITGSQLKALGEFVNRCIGDGQTELSKVTSERFLELAVRGPLACRLAQHLVGMARAFFDTTAAKWKATLVGKERFRAACLKTGELMQQAGIDLLQQMDFEEEMAARAHRLQQMSEGATEKIVLSRVVKAFFRQHLPELCYVSNDRGCLRFQKPLAGPVKIVVEVDKDKVGGLGKAFGINLGIDAEAGPYAGMWLMRDIVEIAGVTERLKKAYVWRYTTSEDLDRILNDIEILLRQVLPFFEQSLREEMLDQPTDS